MDHSNLTAAEVNDFYFPDSISSAQIFSSPTLLNNEIKTAENLNLLDVVEDLDIKIDVAISESSISYKEFIITVSLLSELTLDNVQTSLLLPPGLRKIDADSWLGSLEGGIIRELFFPVEAASAFKDQLEVVVVSEAKTDLPHVASATLDVSIGYSAPSIPSSMVVVENRAENIVQTTYTPSALGELIVEGNWFFYDQSFTAKPARFARVELWDDDTPNDVLLATSYVESDGSFRFPAIINDDGASEGGYDIYVKLVCDSDGAVFVTNSIGQTYAASTEVMFDVADGVLDVGSWVLTGDSRGCFGLFDSVIEAHDWLYDQVSWERPEVWVRWPTETWPHSHGDRIDIPGGSGWEWDRSTIYHEYAHCVQYASRDSTWPPDIDGPDPHYVDSESSLGFAFVEGWAEFFECAVSSNPYSLDFYYSVESAVFADGPRGHGDSGDWDGSIVEGAVASVFWDMFDGISGSDYPSYSFGKVGDLVEAEFSQLWSIMLNENPDNIDEIWDFWAPKDIAVWAIFYNSRINYDTTVPSTVLVASLSHPDQDQIYSNSNPSFSWNPPSVLSGIAGYSIIFDNNSLTNPDTSIDTTLNSKSYSGISDGDWYFHIRAVSNAGNWGSTAHYRVRIQTESTSEFIITGFNVEVGGKGYTTPAVLIAGGGGSGATATARVRNGIITAVVLTNPGVGYTSSPEVVVKDPNPRSGGVVVTPILNISNGD